MFRSARKLILFTAIASIALGLSAVAIVVNEPNGYIAGFTFFFLFLLITLGSGALIIGGIVTAIINQTRRFAPLLVLAAVLLPSSFFVGASVAKQFELGAYRQEPMVTFPPSVANKVLFKKEATHDEIEKFWSHVIGYPTGGSSHWTRPGVAGGARTPAENGHDVVIFSFRPDATGDQKADIRARIKAYSPIYQFLENIDTNPKETPPPVENQDSPPKKEVREPTRFEHPQ